MNLVGVAYDLGGRGSTLVGVACDLGGRGLNLVGVAYDLGGRGSTLVSVACDLGGRGRAVGGRCVFNPVSGNGYNKDRERSMPETGCLAN